tara:strand:- start:164 stop:499 length:336 start_codon:yes stop_codon:yes gene_type:complete
MKLYIIDLPRLSLPRTAFSSKQEAVKAARAALKAECEEERAEALDRVEDSRYTGHTLGSTLNSLERQAKALRPEPFGPADLQCLDLPATKAGLILAYEAGFNDGQTHGESI